MVVVVVVVLGLLAVSAAPSVQSTSPVATPENLVGQLVSLNDPDPAVRDAARRHILSLHLDDLPRLVRAVEALPEAAAKSAATRLVLRDAVEHIYIRDAKLRLLELRESGGRGGPFLGILRSYGELNGVMVRRVWPGFIAYETLEDGDVLVGLRTEAGVARIRDFEDLTSAFYGLSPGDAVELVVVRSGRVLQIPLLLDERVEDTDPEWARARPGARVEAEAFWTEQLAPLLQDRAGSSASSDD